MKMTSFEVLNCSEFLQQYVFLKDRFTSISTFNILVERFETIRAMVYHEMPVQRMNVPGKIVFG